MNASTTMLGRVVLLVRDFDEALSFYRAALGAQILHDASAGGQRYLHIGLPGQPEGGIAPVGIWFLEADGDAAGMVGRQAGGHPFLVLYTDDCRAAVDRFTAAGGRIRHPLREDEGSLHAHVEDVYGNVLLLVQLRSA